MPSLPRRIGKPSRRSPPWFDTATPRLFLMDEIQTSGFDLLVVGRHGVSVLDERLLGSVTLNLLHHAPCDVLLVP